MKKSFPVDIMTTNTQKLHDSEWVYSSTISLRLLSPLSEYIHDLPSLPLPAELCIAACGYAFNPVLFPCWLALVYASSIFFVCERRQLLSSNEYLSKNDGARYHHRIMALNNAVLYVVSVLTTLLVTEICKAIFATTRPSKPQSSSQYYNRRKYEHLITSLKSKHSFPSGDTAQAMNLCMILCRYVIPSSCDSSSSTAAVGMPLINSIMNVFLFGMFLPGVAFARVYYRCHWIEDCLGGMLLSLILHSTLIPIIESRMF